MTFGLTFVNDNDVVTLDSEFSRLVVVESGTFLGTGSAGGTFAQVVTTDEPPLIFIRPDQSGTFCFCTITGSSGAWTGFSFVGIVGVDTSGKWFSATFRPTETAKFGFRLWDENSKLLFDSGTPCAQFTRTISAWIYLGATQTSQGVYRLSWTADTPLGGGDYMLLNNIAMDLAGGTSRQGNLYALWQYESDRLLIQAVGVDLKTSLYIPVVFAKPVN